MDFVQASLFLTLKMYLLLGSIQGQRKFGVFMAISEDID